MASGSPPLFGARGGPRQQRGQGEKDHEPEACRADDTGPALGTERDRVVVDAGAGLRHVLAADEDDPAEHPGRVQREQPGDDSGSARLEKRDRERRHDGRGRPERVIAPHRRARDLRESPGFGRAVLHRQREPGGANGADDGQRQGEQPVEPGFHCAIIRADETFEQQHHADGAGDRRGQELERQKHAVPERAGFHHHHLDAGVERDERGREQRCKAEDSRETGTRRAAEQTLHGRENPARRRCIAEGRRERRPGVEEQQADIGRDEESAPRHP